MAWKYIMFENHIGDTVLQFPVIFPDKLVHADVYAHLKVLMPGWSAQGVKAASAGTIEHVHVKGLSGNSETLRKQSRPEEDSRTIHTYSYLHGVL